MRGQFVAVDQRAARDTKTALGKRKQIKVETPCLRFRWPSYLLPLAVNECDKPKPSTSAWAPTHELKEYAAPIPAPSVPPCT